MKNKILCFGLVLIFLASMCGCNAEKADILESSDIADCSSSVSNTETSDETDTTVESEPEKATETAITTSEPASETNEPETAPTESKNPVETEKTDIPAAPKTETETPKPEAPKPTASEEIKEPEKEAPTEQPTEEVKPKTAYDYEFDIEAIRNDLISLGCSMGLTHITTDDGMTITPDNASWATPVTASESFQGERLKRKLTDYVQSMPDIITAYGGAPIEYFTIYIEPLGSGSYRIYFLY